LRVRVNTPDRLQISNLKSHIQNPTAQSCRAYEDTELGLQAIRAAGMEAVDVRGFYAKR